MSAASSRTDARSDRVDYDTSVSSNASERDGGFEKRAARKIRALQTKLEMSEQRVTILEKEKADLRDELVTQIESGKKTPRLSVDAVDLKKELTETKGKLSETKKKLANATEELEAKMSFICDLRNELQRSFNLLIEKQKEVDEYRQKETETPRSSLSDPLQLNTESNISEQKKRKWELMQDIFKQQRQFYERKNLHLGHFEKFQNHIEKLRSLQGLQKSESEPLLNASVSAASRCYAEKCDRTLRDLQIELEMDVQCLQNLSIFLKRFFIPFVMQGCQSSKSDPKNDGSGSGAEASISKSLFRQTKSLSEEKLAKSEFPKRDFEKTSSIEVLRGSSSRDRLVSTASVISQRVDSLQNILKGIKSELGNMSDIESVSTENPRAAAEKSALLKLASQLSVVIEKSDPIYQLNSTLKMMDLVHNGVPKSPTKDMSDRESLLSEEAITLSRSGSLSPMSFEEHFPSKLVAAPKRPDTSEEQKDKNASAGLSHKTHAAGGSQESIFQRSHFSSPDLGIESDPNHESSAPEQAECRDGASRKWYDISAKGKQTPSSVCRRGSDSNTPGDPSRMTGSDSLHAIGMLQHYQLLKKEVQESLVGVKVVLSRTEDGLHQVAKYTSPRKSMECSTLKAIRDECRNIEMCLREAAKLVDAFWIAPCPSVEDLKALIQQNQDLHSKLEILQEAKRRQQSCFEQAMDKLKNSEVLRENMEKKVSKKLVKTKKVIREVESRMLHRKNQALPPLPKFPEETSSQKEQ